MSLSSGDAYGYITSGGQRGVVLLSRSISWFLGQPLTSEITGPVWLTAQVKSGLTPMATGHSVGADPGPTELL